MLVILYKLLTGKPPFPPVDKGEGDLLAALRKQRLTLPVAPGQLNPAASPAVDAIVRKLLEPEPGGSLCPDRPVRLGREARRRRRRRLLVRAGPGSELPRTARMQLTCFRRRA